MDNIERINNSIMQKKFDSLKKKMRKSAEGHSKYIIFNEAKILFPIFLCPETREITEDQLMTLEIINASLSIQEKNLGQKQLINYIFYNKVPKFKI